MATRAITGTILRPDGTPWAGASVRFITTDDAYTVSPANTLPLYVVTAVTDEYGQFTVSLVADLSVNYKVTLPDRSSFEITVPSGSPTTLEALRAATSGMPVPIDSLEALLIELYGAPPAGRAAVKAREGGTVKVNEVTDIDWDASDFDVTESPTGRANIALAYGSTAGTPAEGNHTHALPTLAQLGWFGIAQSADYTGSNSSSAQKIFNESTNGAASLVALTSYWFRGTFHIHSTGTTSATLNLLFGGTATLTSIGYRYISDYSTSETFSATSSGWSSVATATALGGAVASIRHYTIFVEGIVRVNAAGTFIPQYQFSSAPGVAPVTLRNSAMILIPIGSNTAGTFGTWS